MHAKQFIIAYFTNDCITESECKLMGIREFTKFSILPCSTSSAPSGSIQPPHSQFLAISSFSQQKCTKRCIFYLKIPKIFCPTPVLFSQLTLCPECTSLSPGLPPKREILGNLRCSPTLSQQAPPKTPSKWTSPLSISHQSVPTETAAAKWTKTKPVVQS